MEGTRIRAFPGPSEIEAGSHAGFRAPGGCGAAGRAPRKPRPWKAAGLGALLAVLALPAAAQAAVRTWTNGSADGKFSTAGNWTGGVPGANDDAVYNATSTAACLVDVPATVANFKMLAGYTGTVNASSNLSVGSHLTLNSGTLKCAGASHTLSKDFNFGGGVFDAETSTWTFTGGAQSGVNGAPVFYNLTAQKSNNTVLAFNNGATVLNSLVLTDGKVNGSTLTFQGSSITVGAGLDGGTGSLKIASTGAVTLTCPAAAHGGDVMDVEVAMAAQTLKISGFLRTSKKLTLTEGVVDPQDSTVTAVAGSGPIAGPWKFNNLVLEGSVAVSDAVQVANLFTISDGGPNTGVVEVKKDFSISQNADASSATVKFTGEGNSTWTSSQTDMQGETPKIEIQKTGAGAVSLSGTARLQKDLTLTRGSFSPGTSTVVVAGGMKVTGPFSFNNLSLKAGAGSLDVASQVEVLGTLFLDTGGVTGGKVNAKGPITYGAGYTGKTGTVAIVGAADQTVTGGGSETTGGTDVVEIAKPSGNLNLASTWRVDRDVTHVSGAVNPGTGKVVLAGSLNLGGNGLVFNKLKTATPNSATPITIGGSIEVKDELDLQKGRLDQGTISAKGPVIQGAQAGGGSGTLIFANQSADQALTGGGAGADLPNVVVNVGPKTLTVSGTVRTTKGWTHTSGNVTTTGSTLIWAGALTVQGNPPPFANVVFETTPGTATPVTLADTMTATGSTTLTSGKIDGGTLSAQGGVTQGANFSGGTGKIALTGSGNATLTGGGSGASLPDLEINKSGGASVSLSGVIGTENDVSLVAAGSVSPGTSTLHFWGSGDSVLSGNIPGASLTVDKSTGKKLTIANNPTLEKDLTLTKGTLVLQGSSLGVKGNVSVGATGTDVQAGTATLVLNGAAAQAVDLEEKTVFSVDVQNASTAGVSFTDGFTASEGSAFKIAPGAKVTFSNADAFNLDLIDFNGTVGSPITLRSDVAGQQWSLKVRPGQTVNYVDVKDSDATSGGLITAANSTNSGNNLGWTFGPGAATVWIRNGTGGVWSDGPNWSTGVPPNSGTDVEFNGTGTAASSVDAAFTVNSVAIKSGYTNALTQNSNLVSLNWFTQDAGTFDASTATLTVGGDLLRTGGTWTPGTSTVVLDGAGAGSSQGVKMNGADFYGLTVAAGTNTVHALDSFRVKGALSQSGGTLDLHSQTLTAEGDVSRTGGALVGSLATVTADGAANQTVNFGADAALKTVSSTKTGGTLTFGTNGFTATNLAISQGDTVKFQGNKRFKVTNLTLDGVSGNPVILEGTTAGQGWDLELVAGGTQANAFVNVKDSNASFGAIADGTMDCVDNGGNQNWDVATGNWLLTATSNASDLTKVYLRYTVPMDPATATDPTKYTLSGGLTVLATPAPTITPDGKLVTLTASGNITLGTTTVTATKVKAATLFTMAQTTKTIVDGTSFGAPAAGVVTLRLSTNDFGDVIQINHPRPKADNIPNLGCQVTMRICAPGTAARTLKITQRKESGGAGRVFMGATGAAEEATVTTSGGTENCVDVILRAADQSAFEKDIVLEAEDITDATVRGEKKTTVIRATRTPERIYHADSRPVMQMIQTAPAVEGVCFTMRAFAIGRDITIKVRSPLGDFTPPPTGADGTVSYDVPHPGVDAFWVWSCQVKTDNAADNSHFCEPCSRAGVMRCHYPGPPGSGPQPGTSDFCSACNAAKAQHGGKGSVDLADGEKKIQAHDLAISGRGMDWSFRRVYRGANYRTNFPGRGTKDFGENWTFSYSDEYLALDREAGTSQDLSNVVNYRAGNNANLFIVVSSGKWEAPLQNYVLMRRNPTTGKFELRDEDGTVRIYNDFSTVAVPNANGRLVELRDRNDNRITLHYEQIDPDDNDGDANPATNPNGDEKFILAFVVDTMGREIRYQYYAKAAQVQGGRTVAIVHPSALTASWGRLAKVSDFKGDMDFDGTPSSQDFAGQTNNRTVTFDYDDEGNLTRVSSPAITGTPHGNDFPSGKTTRYKYIRTADLPGGLTVGEQARLLHKLTHIFYPNEVKSSPGTEPPPADAAETLTYFSTTGHPFLGFVSSYAIGGTNGNAIPSGGAIAYTYTDLNPTRAFGPPDTLDRDLYMKLPTLKAEATSRKGDQAEYVFEGGKTLKEFREFPRGFRSSEPEEFLLQSVHTQERLLTDYTHPEGNTTQYVFNNGSSDRFQQSNLIRVIRVRDSDRGGDQTKIETVMVYEPIYNRPHLVVSPRGVDKDGNGFTPPIADPADRVINDPYIPSKKLNLRYATVSFFDYQESKEKASAAPAGRLDIDGSGGQVNGSPLIGVDANVLTTEVWLIQEVGLTEDAAGLTELRARLSSNLLKLGLGDLNGDGDASPKYQGNVIRTIQPSPVLIANTNQHELEKDIETAGDLIDESLPYADGGAFEKNLTTGVNHGSRLQTIVALYQFSGKGQLVKSISAEGNANVFEYFGETDPDGDGVATPGPADGRSLDGSTGGYLKESTTDTARSYVQQTTGADLSAATFNNNKTNPGIATISGSYTYDDVGNAVSSTNARGIRTDYFVNEHDETVQVTRAADVSAAASASPSDPLVGASIGPLTAFAYKSQTFYDFNGNAVLSQAEDRGNTSATDGNGLKFEDDNDGSAATLVSVPIPAQAVDTTPGITAADGGDPAGGLAFVDSLNLFDRLNNLIESRVEVDATRMVRTRTRYDGNENRVLTIYPEGNADSSVLDERDLVLSSTRGVSAAPSAGLYAGGDPTTFHRPGGSGTTPSTFTYNYDLNQNLVETVDASDTDGDSSNNSAIAGFGEATRITYDGFDRRKVVTDALGNEVKNVYDPDSNVVRTIMNGDPVDDVLGSGENKTLAVTEYIHDELSRVVATHSVLFQTPVAAPTRVPALTDTAAMDTLVPYLADAGTDTAAVPGAISGLTILGRVSTISEYDRQSRTTFSVQDDLDVYRSDYDGASRVVKSRDSILGNGFAAGAFDPDTAGGNTVETLYDDNSNVIERKETDVTTISGVSSESFLTTSLFDSLDRLQTVMDNIGQTADYRYDSRSNLVAMADAVGPVTTRTISRRGLGSGSVTVNDFGNVSRTRYDGISRTLETEARLTASGQGDGTNIGATLEGVLSTAPVVDAAQSGDGLISVYYAYDDNSQLLALRDDDGNTTAYPFDNQNRTLKERKGLGETGTTFAISGGDAGRFNVALRGGVSPVDTEATGTDIAYAYDPDSNVPSRTDEAGNVMSCLFDGLNRQKSCVISRVAGFIGTSGQTHKFDGLSRQTECLDNNEPATTADDVLCKYFFDSLSRKHEEQQKIGAGTVKSISCSFDIAAGQAIGSPTACFYPDGRRVDSTFDSLDRLVAKRDNGQSSDIGKYEYLGSWRVATLTYQNGTRLTHLSGTTDVGFDALRRIIAHRWEVVSSGARIVEFGHKEASGAPAFDRANNKKIEEKAHDPDSSEVYVYDSVYRLRDPGSDYRDNGSGTGIANAFRRGTLNASKKDIATLTARPGERQTEDWGLEGVGNWASHTRQDQGAAVITESRSHSDFNEIDTRTTGGQNSGLAYDKNGNTTDTGNTSVAGQDFPGGGLRMEWDALNRLRKVFKNSNTPGSTGDDVLVSVHTYDCMNRRFRKVVTNSGSFDGTTDYFYEGWRVMEERNASDAVTLQYVWGNYLDEAWTLDNRTGGVTVGQLNDGSGTNRLHYHQNTLYSVFGLADETGGLQEAYQYDAYGKHTVVQDGPDADSVANFGADDVRTVGGTPGFSNVLTYTEQRIDSETTLVYFKSRFYSNTLGRFLARDNVGYLFDKNLYGYVKQRLTALTDPMGLGGETPENAPKPRATPATPTQSQEKAPAPPPAGSGAPGAAPPAPGGATETTPAPTVPTLFREKQGYLNGSHMQEVWDQLAQFNEWAKNNQEKSWLQNLADCPCELKLGQRAVAVFCHPYHPGLEPPKSTVFEDIPGTAANPSPDTWNDPSQSLHGYHHGAKWCMRSKKANKYGAGQQCCYDDNLKLITRGEGAGTPDRVQRSGWIGTAWHYTVGGGHMGADVDPWDWAEYVDFAVGGHPLRSQYLDLRPPNPGKDAQGNPCTQNP